SNHIQRKWICLIMHYKKVASHNPNKNTSLPFAALGVLLFSSVRNLHNCFVPASITMSRLLVVDGWLGY
ncbi:hypothetical protein, partial [Pseudoalteromonas sp. T1lg75]|uniref:hypothetical protein n=1 Tax=Pseudoalteromonas sp. T1lg75 TaxID=2077102 RepID=UPI001F240852